jgi:hypothetical protein
VSAAVKYSVEHKLRVSGNTFSFYFYCGGIDDGGFVWVECWWKINFVLVLIDMIYLNDVMFLKVDVAQNKAT